MSPFGKVFLSIVAGAGVAAFLAEGMLLWAAGWACACGLVYYSVKFKDRL